MYIVCWMERNPNTHRISDHYVALDTKEEAQVHYNLILSKSETYSVNLTKVLESTDHTPKKRPKKVRYWVVMCDEVITGAYITNQDPSTKQYKTHEIIWSGFSEKEAQFQINRYLNMNF